MVTLTRAYQHGQEDDSGAGCWLDFAQAHGQAAGDGADDGHGDDQVDVALEFHGMPRLKAKKIIK